MSPDAELFQQLQKCFAEDGRHGFAVQFLLRDWFGVDVSMLPGLSISLKC